jgi:molybdate transport system ATP-binding protein
MSTLQVRLQSAGPIALNAEFECQPGELVALLGASGSGKTSILRAVAGLLPVAGLHGTVKLGSDTWFDSAAGIHRTPQTRRVGLVFQNYALYPHLNAIENIALSADRTSANGLKRAYVQALMDRLGLAGLAQRLPAQLSGGQQQRVAVARALMRLYTGSLTQPTPAQQGVLLLDEPFSAVDAPTRQTLYRELATLRQTISTPMVLVTHDLYEARRLADRIVVIDAGETLQSGTPAKVFAQPRNARVAQLVGIQNLFKGLFYKRESGWGELHWLGGGEERTSACPKPLVLHTLDKNRIDDGAEVSWVLAGESLEVIRSETNTDTNVLVCAVQEVLGLGETSLCTLAPNGAGADRLTLTLSTAQLLAVGVVVGQWVHVRVNPAGIHIMPLRSAAHRN